MADEILLEIHNKVANITFNRPDQHNAIAYDGWLQLIDIVSQIKLDPDIRVVVFSGAGSRSFSAGADIRDFDSHRYDSASSKIYSEAFDGALDEMVAYMVGDQEYFEIKVQLSERADVIAEEVKKLLMSAGLSEFLFDDIVDPLLKDNLEDVTDLSLGVHITREDIAMALRESVPEEWLEEQVSGVIDEVGQYVIGNEDTLQVSIPLVDLKDMVIATIEELAYARLNVIVGSLPECNLGQMPSRGIVSPEVELPRCVPAETGLEQLVDSLDIYLTDEVRGVVDIQSSSLRHHQIFRILKRQ